MQPLPEDIRRLELLRLTRQSQLPIHLRYDHLVAPSHILPGMIPVGSMMHLPMKTPLHPSFRSYYSGLASQSLVSSSLLHFSPPPLPLSVTRGLMQNTSMRLDQSSNESIPSRKLSVSAEQASLAESAESNAYESDKYDHDNALPDDFKPGPNSVIIGRKKNCYTSVGNLRLRDICLSKLPAYSKCGKKKDKSEIVTDIVKLIRDSCPKGGAFVKRDASGGWHEVKDVVARERVASIFRDFLHDQYRSSSKSKVAKRREKRVTQFMKSPDDDDDEGGDDASYETTSNRSDENSEEEVS